jgi:protein-S-isoprenylcysteine O-methyltransferase Ste14
MAMRLIAPFLLGLAGAGILGWAAAVLGWRRWLDLDDTPPGAEVPPLVLAGPFGFVRHPQTLGLLLLLAAAALRWPRPGMRVAALIAAVLIVFLAAADDTRLTERFGEAYRRYRQAVPFLLPRPW